MDTQTAQSTSALMILLLLFLAKWSSVGCVPYSVQRLESTVVKFLILSPTCCDIPFVVSLLSEKLMIGTFHWCGTHYFPQRFIFIFEQPIFIHSSQPLMYSFYFLSKVYSPIQISVYIIFLKVGFTRFEEYILLFSAFKLFQLNL